MYTCTSEISLEIEIILHLQQILNITNMNNEFMAETNPYLCPKIVVFN